MIVFHLTEAKIMTNGQIWHFPRRPTSFWKAPPMSPMCILPEILTMPSPHLHISADALLMLVVVDALRSYFHPHECIPLRYNLHSSSVEDIRKGFEVFRAWRSHTVPHNVGVLRYSLPRHTVYHRIPHEVSHFIRSSALVWMRTL